MLKYLNQPFFMKCMFQKLKNWYYERKAGILTRDGKFSESLEFIKKISYDEREETLGALLGAYAFSLILDEKQEYGIEYIEDKEEYERLILLCGAVSNSRCILYKDPNTEKVDGLDKLVEIIPKDNPLLQYLNEITNCC